MFIIKRFYLVTGIFFLFLLFPFLIFAQTPDKGLESCFNYYDYGKIKAQFSTKKDSYESGDSAEFIGNIVNSNTFPLVDVILYAHVRRINSTTSVDNGHYLVDKVTVLDHLNFLPNESKRIEFKIPIKKTYPAGPYELQYFLFSKQAFHYAGRSFLEEDNAGITNFSVQSDTNPDVYFDINSLQVNNEHHTIREQIMVYPKGPLQLKVGVVDTRPEKTDIPVKIKFYSFEDTDGNKLISQATSTYKPDDKFFSFTFNPPIPGAYVMLLEMNSPVQSMFKYRFASDGVEPSELRMNDVGVSDFPATSQSRAWVCFHSPTRQNSAETTVNLNVLNSSGKPVSSVSMTDSFSGEVQAISAPLFKLATLNDFWVEAIVTQDGKSRSVKIHYNCDDFNSSIGDLKLAYDSSQSDRLLIQTKSVCGQNASHIVLQGLRIKKNGTVIDDVRNYDASSGYYLLKNLSPGRYTAEARFGSFTPKVDFTVSSSISNSKLVSHTSLPIPVIIMLIFLVIVITMVVLFRRKII